MNTNQLIRTPSTQFQNQDYFDAIIESSNDAIIGKTLDGIITSWNPGAERLYGYSPQEVLGQSIFTIFPDDKKDEFLQIMSKLRRGQRIEHYETNRRHKDGHLVDVSVTISPIRDSFGRIIGASSIARNITLQKVNQTADHFLSRASIILSSSLNFHKTLSAVAKLAVPHLADWCGIDILSSNNQVEQLAVAHIDPKKVLWAKKLRQTHPVDMSQDTGLAHVLKTGKSELYPHISQKMIRDSARSQAELTIIQEIGLESVIIVPLIARRHILGAITFVSSNPYNHYTDNHLKLARELASRAAIAIDNAKLYQKSRQELKTRLTIEKQLQNSRDQLEIIFQNIADGITVQDKTGQVIYANDVGAKACGFNNAQELLNLSQIDLSNYLQKYDIRDDTNRPVSQDQLPGRQALDGHPNPQATLQYINKQTGDSFWSLVKARPILDNNGQVTLAVNIISDITQHQEFERQLAASKQRLELAHEVANIGTFEWNLQTDEVFRSPEQERLLGYKPGTFHSSHQAWTKTIHPDDIDSVNNAITDSIENHTEYSSEFRVIHPDKSIHWIAGKGRTFYDEHDQPLRMIGVNIDITGSKNEHETKSRLAAIIQSTDDAIISQTLDGIITSWNPGAERLYGYIPSEVIGKTISVIVPKEYLNELTEIHEVVKLDQSIDRFETFRHKKNGQVIDVSISFSPIKNGQDQVIGLASIARDITEIKELERRKDDFISIASHELKTPVTTMKMFTQLIKKQFTNNPMPNTTRFLDKMDDQLLRLTKLISDLLDISKISAGKLELHKEKFNLDALIKDTIESLQDTSPKHQIILRGQTGKTIFGDQDRINQVLVNLITNAIKYSPRANKVIINLSTNHTTVKISVRDYGIGIAKEHQPKIFDRFFRVSGANERTFPGLGIGLYLSAQIIRRHGGNIEVNSIKSKGSTFTIRLPFK